MVCASLHRLGSGIPTIQSLSCTILATFGARPSPWVALDSLLRRLLMALIRNAFHIAQTNHLRESSYCATNPP